MLKKIFLFFSLCTLMPTIYGNETFTNIYHMITGGGKNFTPVFTRGDGHWTKQSDEEKTGFFDALAEKETQREDWYKVTPHIAEFGCTVSNIGFIAVGLLHKSYGTLFAGCASTLYHCYPKQWLLWLDRIGAAAAIVEVARKYPIFMQNPTVLTAPLSVAGSLLIADVYFGQSKKLHPWLHVAWHLGAAWAAHKLLSHIATT